MKLMMWAIVLFGSLYSFGHAFFLLKDKKKLGAVGISLIGCTIILCSFFIRLK